MDSLERRDIETIPENIQSIVRDMFNRDNLIGKSHPITSQAGILSDEGVMILFLYGDNSNWQHHQIFGERHKNHRINDILQDIFAYISNPDFDTGELKGDDFMLYNWIIGRLEKCSKAPETQFIKDQVRFAVQGALPKQSGGKILGTDISVNVEDYGSARKR